MSSATVVAGLVGAVVLVFYVFVRRRLARLDRGVTFRVWALGFAILVLAGKWSHGHLSADWPWIQSVVVAAGTVLSVLWIDQDAPVRR